MSYLEGYVRRNDPPPRPLPFALGFVIGTVTIVMIFAILALACLAVLEIDAYIPKSTPPAQLSHD